MTKSIIKQSAIFLVVLLVLASCAKKAKQLNYIPKDVSGVLAINAKKMAMKSLELKDLINMDIFKKNLPTSKDSIVDKIKNSGVDLLNTAYIFGDVAKGDQKMYVAAVFALEDEAKFEKTLKDSGKSDEIKSDNDIKYTYVQDAIVGWKDKVGIVLALDGETDKEKKKAKLKELFTQPEENSLAAANDKFQALLKEEADISLYLSYEKLGDVLKQTAQMPLMAGTSFKDTYLTAVVNFENGKIVSDAKIYNNEENTKKAKELYKAAVSKDLVQAQPGGEVIAFMSFGINMDPVVSYLKEAQLLDGVNQTLKSLGPDFDANYIAAALSGDFIATLNALTVKEENKMDYMTGETKPTKVLDYQYAVTIGLKDAAKFQKLLDAVVAKGGVVKADKYYSIMGMAFLVPKSNSIVVVNSETIAKDVAIDKTTPLNAANIDLISANTMALGVDMTKIKPEALDLMGKETAKIINASPFELMVISAEEVKSNVVTTKTVINFKNKEQNSLVSLQKFLNESDQFMPATTTPYASDVVVSDSAAYVGDDPSINGGE